MTALQKGSHKGRHLQECCIFENSKLGRKEEKGRTSNYIAFISGQSEGKLYLIAEPNCVLTLRAYPVCLDYDA